MMAARIALAAVVLTAGAAACDDDDSGESSRREPGASATTFAGTAEGGGTYVAIVVDAEDDALAYATDGAQSVDWLLGSLDGDDTARLENDGGAVLEVVFTEDDATGTFTRPESPPLSFTVVTTAPPAGLYRASESFTDGDYVAGWIVLPDGSQRGAVRRYETPLPPGAVDAMTFSAGDQTFAVPGGALMPRRFGATADL